MSEESNMVTFTVISPKARIEFPLEFPESEVYEVQEILKSAGWEIKEEEQQ